NGQSYVLEQLHFFQRRIRPHFRQRHLPRKLLECSQVRHKILAFVIVGIGIWVTRNFRNGIERALGRSVIAQHAVARAHLLERTNGISPRPCSVPHFLAFYEKGVPVIVVRVGAEDPIVSCSSWYRHRDLKSAELYTLATKKRNKM